MNVHTYIHTWIKEWFLFTVSSVSVLNPPRCISWMLQSLEIHNHKMAKFANAFTLTVVLLGAFSVCNAGIADQLLGTIERLLGDKAFVQRQMPCLLDKGPCDVLGTFATGILKEYYHNDCARCGPEIMASLSRIMATMKRNYPNEANAIIAHYSRKPGRRN